MRLFNVNFKDDMIAIKTILPNKKELPHPFLPHNHSKIAKARTGNDPKPFMGIGTAKNRNP